MEAINCPECAAHEAVVSLKDAVMDTLVAYGVPASVVLETWETAIGSQFLEMCEGDVRYETRAQDGKLCFLCEAMAQDAKESEDA